uniref:Family with sequence similarity 53 member C n=1 Tax=Leptobrachium leishanense TaxID=445787 RepID=A0A8C5PEY9_9ANUR
MYIDFNKNNYTNNPSGKSPLPNQTDPEGCSSPFHFVTEERSWGLLSHCPRIELEDGIRLGCHHHSSLSLHFPVISRENSPHRRSPSHAPEAGNSSAPPAPPTKRHCRSLSVPEDLSRWRPVWRPSGSKVWTPVKRRCNSGGVGAVLAVQTQNPTQGVSRLRFQNDPSASIRCIQANSPPFFSLALCRESPGPYTLSPTGVFWENTEGPSCFPLQRRFSLSPVLIKDAGQFLPSTSSSPPSTPELVRRQHCLPRSQSQPCDLDTRKCGIKRRHEEDTRWHRPSLDFYKMNQVTLLPEFFPSPPPFASPPPILPALLALALLCLHTPFACPLLIHPLSALCPPFAAVPPFPPFTTTRLCCCLLPPFCPSPPPAPSFSPSPALSFPSFAAAHSLLSALSF